MEVWGSGRRVYSGTLGIYPTRRTKSSSLVVLNIWVPAELLRPPDYVDSKHGLRELVMDKEAWSATVHGVENCQTRLSDLTFIFPEIIFFPLRGLHIFPFPYSNGCCYLVTKSCLTLFHPIFCSVHGISQARILEWVTIFFSRESS